MATFIGSICDVPTGIFSSTRETAQHQAHSNLDAHRPPEDDQPDPPNAEHSAQEDTQEQQEIPDIAEATRQQTRTAGSSRAREYSSRHAEALSDAGYRAGQWAKHVTDWAIMVPGDVTLSLSRGFHNAPKLYHDSMIETFPKVIGIRSGFRAAGKVNITPTSSCVDTYIAM